MKTHLAPVLLFVFFVTLSTHVCAQRQTLIGLDAIVESSAATFHPGIGVLFERKLTKHSGFETGLFYKIYHQDGMVTVVTSTSTYASSLRVAQQYVSLLLLYKFYTRIINMSAGPTLDYYTGFTQKDKSTSFTINSYRMSPKLSVGLLVKLSKSFSINKQLLLEPELRLNPNFSYERTPAGLGIAAKYKLH